MSGFLESALGAVCGLIEAGPIKIDNKFVEAIVGVGAVAVAGYATYKVLNDKDAAQNFSTIKNGAVPEHPFSSMPSKGALGYSYEEHIRAFGPSGSSDKGQK